jgi:hypothetical protein
MDLSLMFQVKSDEDCIWGKMFISHFLMFEVLKTLAQGSQYLILNDFSFTLRHIY